MSQTPTTFEAEIRILSKTAAELLAANPVLAAGRMATETDTGKLKVGDGVKAYSALPYVGSNPGEIPWSSVTGKPATFTPSSHQHDASDISTGIMSPARLGSGAASPTAFLRGDGKWAVPDGGGSGGTGTNRGKLYDVRDYGAAAGWQNEASNTAAFQAAVDAAVANQGGGYGGGTVYIPANECTGNTLWDLRSPVWVHGDGLRIQGEGSRATFIRSRGPAFVHAWHPRYWSVKNKTFKDNDNGGAIVNTTATAEGKEQWIGMSHYKPDIYQFRTGGAYPPGSQPEFAPSTGPGTYFAIRPRSGVAQARFPYAPMATGDVRQGAFNSASTWPNLTKVTWEFVVHHHEPHLWGAIAASGGISGTGSGPDPWALYGAGKDGSGLYYFELTMTDRDGIDRTWCRFTVPQNETIGVHRIAIQFDPENTVEADRLIIWVDRVRKTPAFSWWIEQLGGPFHKFNDTQDPGNKTNLWTKWNRIAAWHESDFTVGAESVKVGSYISDQYPYLNDYSVLAVAVHAEALYTNATSQTKLSGGAADDSTVWAMTPGNEQRQNVLGWVANTFDWSPDADANLAVNAHAWGKGRSDVWGYLCPKGSGDWGGHDACKNNSFQGLSIRQSNGFSVSCGILLGPFLEQFQIDDCDPAAYGFFASIGSMWNFVSYYGRFTRLKLNRMVHLIHMTTDAENWDFTFCLNSAIRLTGCEFRLRSFSYAALSASDEGFVVMTNGGGIGAGITLKDGTVNSEGLTFAPKNAMIFVTKQYAHGNNKIEIDNCQFGEIAAPILFLDDVVPQDSTAGKVIVKSIGGMSQGTLVATRGKAWAGEVFTGGPNAYMNEQVKYLPAIAGTNACHVKTVDDVGYGLPACGGFVHDCHEVRVPMPPEGGVAVWRASKSATPTTTCYEGSSNPPDWVPVRFSESRSQHALSANIFPGFYMTCLLPWPNATDPTTIQFTGMTTRFVRESLAAILNGSAVGPRTHISVKWGDTNVYQTVTANYEPRFFLTPAIANSGLWYASSAGSKASKIPVTTSGLTVPDWTVYLRRSWAGAIMIGDSTVAENWNASSAFVFRTNVREPSHWAVKNSDSATIATGGITIKRATRSGGNWTHYASDKLADWFMGGTLSLGSTWYFGLSSTSIDMTAGTGIFEPTGGSYARVPVEKTSAWWGEIGDSGIFANKLAITFPRPTGEWGRMTHWFISDAATGGNIIACGPLNRMIRASSGDPQPAFGPGCFQIQL